MNKNNIDDMEWFRKISKPELHIHFRGFLSDELFCDLLIKQMQKGYFPSSDPLCHFNEGYRAFLEKSTHLSGFLEGVRRGCDLQELRKLCEELWNFKGSRDFFQTYVLTGGLSLDAEGYDPLADHMSQYFKKENIIYAELIFSIGEYLDMGWSYAEIRKLLSYIGMKARECGCDLYVVLDFVRTIAPEVSLKRIHEILKQDLPYVIGLTLGGDEKNHPPKKFKDLFRVAHEAGWKSSCHAGEFTDHHGIIEAVLELGVQRIGHGLSAYKDPYTCDLLKDRGITLEVCPTSNRLTGAWPGAVSDHPARRLYEKGVMLTIASDDPGFFGTSLCAELALCHRELGFSLHELQGLIQQGFKSSFMMSAS